MHSTNSSASAEKVLSVPSMSLFRPAARSGPACNGSSAGAAPPESIDARYVGRLFALGARDHVELDAITLRQRPEALAADGREVDEHLLTAILLDESESLALVEPLDRALLAPGSRPRRGFHRSPGARARGPAPPRPIASAPVLARLLEARAAVDRPFRHRRERHLGRLAAVRA